MTIAQSIIAQYTVTENGKQKVLNADLSNACASQSVDQDQDWENETTIHTFSDGSKVKDCNCQVELI